MPVEIERKFLVKRDRLVLPHDGQRIVQGFLPAHPDSKTIVRVRIRDDQAWLTVKGENTGAVRPEFEYSIPLADADTMLDTLCARPFISKTRYEIPAGARTWEIDVFDGENSGLIVAEIELEDAEEAFDRPDWLGAEVTDDPRYFNSNLRERPYRAWEAVDD